MATGKEGWQEFQRLFALTHKEPSPKNINALGAVAAQTMSAYQKSACDTADTANERLQQFQDQCNRVIRSQAERLTTLERERSTDKKRIADLEQELTVVRRAANNYKRVLPPSLLEIADAVNAKEFTINEVVDVVRDASGMVTTSIHSRA